MAHPVAEAFFDKKGTQLARLRQCCAALPGLTEKLAWGRPCFYAGKKMFAMFCDNHHDDGRLAVWLKAPPGALELLQETAPAVVFKPPYVGPFGWIGLELKKIDHSALAHHVLAAYRLAANKTMLKQFEAIAR